MTTLNQIIRGEAVLERIPADQTPFIIGADEELGVGNKNGSDEFTGTIPFIWLLNGGNFHTDIKHIELCPPETRNPLQTALQILGMRKYFVNNPRDFRMVDKIFANALGYGYKDDSTLIEEGVFSDPLCERYLTTYGYHENYSYITKVEGFTLTNANFSLLAPFWATRPRIVGGGALAFDGTMCYSHHACALQQRRKGALSDIEGDNEDRRLHIILGEANLCPYALALRFGMVSLLFDAMSITGAKELPFSGYDSASLHTDLIKIATKQQDWIDIGSRLVHVDEVLQAYHEYARKHLEKKNFTTDLLLGMWQYVHNGLIRDPKSCLGFVDYVTKEWYLETMLNNGVGDDSHATKLAHLFDFEQIFPVSKTFPGFVDAGIIKPLFSESLVKTALYTPPTDTRAYGRSLLLQFIYSIKGDILINNEMGWNSFAVKHSELGPFGYNMPDSFNTYVDLVHKAKEESHLTRLLRLRERTNV